MPQEREQKAPIGALSYRVATKDDLVFLQRMIEDSFRHPDTWAGESAGIMLNYSLSLEGIEAKFHRAGSIFIIASEEDANGSGDSTSPTPVACFQVVRKSPTLARFATFAVDAQHQGRGLARPVVLYAEDYCRRTWGATTMQLNTLSSRRELLAWYRRCGYLETGVVEPFPSGSFAAAKGREEDASDLCFIVMEKELEAAAAAETRDA